MSDQFTRHTDRINALKPMLPKELRNALERVADGGWRWDHVSGAYTASLKLLASAAVSAYVATPSRTATSKAEEWLRLMYEKRSKGLADGDYHALLRELEAPFLPLRKDKREWDSVGGLWTLEEALKKALEYGSTNVAAVVAREEAGARSRPNKKVTWIEGWRELVELRNDLIHDEDATGDDVGAQSGLDPAQAKDAAAPYFYGALAELLEAAAFGTWALARVDTTAKKLALDRGAQTFLTRPDDAPSEAGSECLVWGLDEDGAPTHCVPFHRLTRLDRWPEPFPGPAGDVAANPDAVVGTDTPTAAAAIPRKDLSEQVRVDSAWTAVVVDGRPHLLLGTEDDVFLRDLAGSSLTELGTYGVPVAAIATTDDGEILIVQAGDELVASEGPLWKNRWRHTFKIASDERLLAARVNGRSLSLVTSNAAGHRRFSIDPGGAVFNVEAQASPADSAALNGGRFVIVGDGRVQRLSLPGSLGLGTTRIDAVASATLPGKYHEHDAYHFAALVRRDGEQFLRWHDHEREIESAIEPGTSDLRVIADPSGVLGVVTCVGGTMIYRSVDTLAATGMVTA